MRLPKLSFFSIALLSLSLSGCGGDNIANGDDGTTPGDGNDLVDPGEGNPGDDDSYTLTVDTTPRILQRGQSFTLIYELDKVTPSALNYDLAVSGNAVSGEDYTISTTSALSFAAGSDNASITIITNKKPDIYDGVTLALAFTNSADETLTQQFLISGNVYLNDTGLLTYSDSNDYALASQTGGDYAMQDAAYGLDVIINSAAVANNGGDIPDSSRPLYKNSLDLDSNDSEYKGPVGFRFIKLADNGMPVAATSNNYACVADEVTGLTWQVKGPANIITNLETDPTLPGRYKMTDNYNYMAANFSYPWSASKLGTPGKGWSSTLDGKTLDTADLKKGEDFANAYCGYLPDANGERDFDLYCNSGSYANETNYFAICGQTNWVVPSVEQLRSIIDYNKAVDVTAATATDHVLAETFFDCPTNDCVLPPTDSNPLYWTSSQVKGAEGLAWCVNLQNGTVQTCNKREFNKVILVSSNVPTEFFTPNTADANEAIE